MDISFIPMAMIPVTAILILTFNLRIIPLIKGSEESSTTQKRAKKLQNRKKTPFFLRNSAQDLLLGRVGVGRKLVRADAAVAPRVLRLGLRHVLRVLRLGQLVLLHPAARQVPTSSARDDCK